MRWFVSINRGCCAGMLLLSGSLLAPSALAQQSAPRAPFVQSVAPTIGGSTNNPSNGFAQPNGFVQPGLGDTFPLSNSTGPATSMGPLTAPLGLPDLSKRDNFSSAMQIIILLTVLSLAPAILIMMTSFTRIIIVLSLLRQALGTQQLPPNQILMGLALFMTFLVMGKTWTRVNNEALQPYLGGHIEQREALDKAIVPVRGFMIAQIRYNKNDEDVFLFTGAAHLKRPGNWNDVGTMTLIPAFMLSELKAAFLQGFKIYLPFLIIDMVISSVLISMGMMMLPPALISLPFKLLLFVLVDGWRLITGSLMISFAGQ